MTLQVGDKLIMANDQATADMPFKSILPIFKQRPLRLRFESPKTCSAQVKPLKEEAEKDDEEEDDEEDDEDEDEEEDEEEGEQIGKKGRGKRGRGKMPFTRRRNSLDLDRLSDTTMQAVSAIIVSAMLLLYLFAAAVSYTSSASSTDKISYNPLPFAWSAVRASLSIDYRAMALYRVLTGAVMSLDCTRCTLCTHCTVHSRYYPL
jgi:outer membrane biosynthesis protein TonB